MTITIQAMEALGGEVRRRLEEDSLNRIRWMGLKDRIGWGWAEGESYSLQVEYGNLQTQIDAYKQRARANPLSHYIELCMNYMISEGAVQGQSYIESFSVLSEKMGFFKDKERLVLDFDAREHLVILDRIRCEKSLSWKEKRVLIHFYLRLTRDVSKYTLGAFQAACDLEQEEASNKLLGYWKFFEFIRFLSRRDALIAKFLYFGAPGIEDVILLRISDARFEDHLMRFQEKDVRFPAHVMQDLYEYLKDRERADGLIFLNVRGDGVERTHLIKAFSRASAAFGEGRITPSTLLQTKAPQIL